MQETHSHAQLLTFRFVSGLKPWNLEAVSQEYRLGPADVIILHMCTQELLDRQSQQIDAELVAKEEEMRKLEEVRHRLQTSQR